MCVWGGHLSCDSSARPPACTYAGHRLAGASAASVDASGVPRQHGDLARCGGAPRCKPVKRLLVACIYSHRTAVVAVVLSAHPHHFPHLLVCTLVPPPYPRGALDLLKRLHASPLGVDPVLLDVVIEFLLASALLSV